MPPLVGVSTYYADAAWGPWSRPAAVVPATYVEVVAAAGGQPVLLPPTRTGGPGDPDRVVGSLDALVLVGGGDVDPAAYGQPAAPETAGVDPVRDAAELALLNAALRADLPVLAVCRGHQLLNVHLGGTLVQHLPAGAHQPGPGKFTPVDVATEPGTMARRILGAQLRVACSHHQAIDRLGEGLVVTARSVEAEPVVEAVELPAHRFVLGVQWHPEETGDPRLFAALVAAAR